jgi:hypothetical protein
MNARYGYVPASRAAVVAAALEAAYAAPPTTSPIATTAIPAPIIHFLILGNLLVATHPARRVVLLRERLAATFEEGVKSLRRPAEGLSGDPPWMGGNRPTILAALGG